MDGELGEQADFREPLLSDRLTRRQRVAWALAWSVCVAAAWAALVWATKDLVQWDNTSSARDAQVTARWIVLLACLVLAVAAVVSERVIGSRTGAVFSGGDGSRRPDHDMATHPVWRSRHSPCQRLHADRRDRGRALHQHAHLTTLAANVQGHPGPDMGHPHASIWTLLSRPEGAQLAAEGRGSVRASPGRASRARNTTGTPARSFDHADSCARPACRHRQGRSASSRSGSPRGLGGAVSIRGHPQRAGRTRCLFQGPVRAGLFHDHVEDLPRVEIHNWALCQRCLQGDHDCRLAIRVRAWCCCGQSDLIGGLGNLDSGLLGAGVDDYLEFRSIIRGVHLADVLR